MQIVVLSEGGRYNEMGSGRIEEQLSDNANFGGSFREVNVYTCISTVIGSLKISLVQTVNILRIVEIEAQYATSG